MAILRVYFKDDPKVEDLGKEISLLSEKGRRYINIYYPHSDSIPEIPKDLIECVTLVDSEVYGVLRRQGVYRHREGKLVVDTHKSTKDGSYFQGMEGSGPTIASIMEIYSLVRQGKLWPEEDWEAPQIVPSRINLKEPLNHYWTTVRNFFSNLLGKMRIPKLPRSLLIRK